MALHGGISLLEESSVGEAVAAKESPPGEESPPEIEPEVKP
jgi:hypothetical protein